MFTLRLMVTVGDFAKLGWSLSPEGLDYLLSEFEEENPRIHDVIKIALDTDLKHIATPKLPEDLNQCGKIIGPMILQVNKVRNVSAPKIHPYQGLRVKFMNNLKFFFIYKIKTFFNLWRKISNFVI
jgi:hypothetical protein